LSRLGELFDDDDFKELVQNKLPMLKMYFIPLDVQSEIFIKLGRNAYFKMPPPGTNPRGVEFSKEALKAMKGHARTKSISIGWNEVDIDSWVFG
jgi:hypothetical protein